MNSTNCTASELIELLLQASVKLLTTYRQLKVQQFGPGGSNVTTDFEALYAYKHGDYQRCLQLSTQNVHVLLNAKFMQIIATFPEFIQLLDDDIVSLTALALIINPQCRRCSLYTNITQLTLVLYLMTQCQMKLHHSVSAVIQTLDYVKVAQRKHAGTFKYKPTLNQLTLKLIERKLATYITN